MSKSQKMPICGLRHSIFTLISLIKVNRFCIIQKIFSNILAIIILVSKNYASIQKVQV